MVVKEKVKEVPADGYCGYGYGRRDINGKANAGLTLGIIGTALGAWSLFGNRRGDNVLSSLGLGSGSGMDAAANIAIASCGASGGNGITAPTAFQAWEKECEDTLALQKGLYDWALTQQAQRFADRQTLDSELFSLWKGQIDADFGLYKSTRVCIILRMAGSTVVRSLICTKQRKFVRDTEEYFLHLLQQLMYMLQSTLSTMIMQNCLRAGLVMV